MKAGDTFGFYRILDKLGEGGMGEVYRARDTALNRDVAIKIIPDLFAGDPERLARFSREAQTLAALNHPNIAHVYGLERSGLVMELVDGQDLAQRLAHGPLPIDDALPIAMQIVDALEAAHDVGAISYSPRFRGLLFGTWSRDKTFGPDDARGAHKDYQGARFQRHLDAVEQLQAIARSGGLSCAQLCVGVLLATPGLTGVICGARDARQGALVANLGVTITADQSRQVWAVADQLRKDLETLSGVAL